MCGCIGKGRGGERLVPSVAVVHFCARLPRRRSFLPWFAWCVVRSCVRQFENLKRVVHFSEEGHAGTSGVGIGCVFGGGGGGEVCDQRAGLHTTTTTTTFPCFSLCPCARGQRGVCVFRWCRDPCATRSEESSACPMRWRGALDPLALTPAPLSIVALYPLAPLPL